VASQGLTARRIQWATDRNRVLASWGPPPAENGSSLPAYPNCRGVESSLAMNPGSIFWQRNHIALPDAPCPLAMPTAGFGKPTHGTVGSPIVEVERDLSGRPVKKIDGGPLPRHPGTTVDGHSGA
jgi:hypothetical protein